MITHNAKDVARDINRSLNAKRKAIRRANDEILRSVEYDSKRNLATNNSIARGEMINSISRDKTTVGVRAEYAGFVEFGTKGKVRIPAGLQYIVNSIRVRKRRFSEFLEDLEEWAKSKGIFTGKGQVYKIAINLLEEGQTAKPFFFPAVFKNKIKWVKNLKKALRERR